VDSKGVSIRVDRLSGRFALCVVNDIYLLRQNACTIYSHAHISPRDINLSTRARKVAGATRTALSFRRKSASRCGLRNTSACIVAFSPDDGRGLISLHRSPCFRARARARVTYVCDYKRNESSFAFSMARSLSVLVSDARVNDQRSSRSHIHARMRTAVIDFHREDEKRDARVLLHQATVQLFISIAREAARSWGRALPASGCH